MGNQEITCDFAFMNLGDFAFMDMCPMSEIPCLYIGLLGEISCIILVSGTELLPKCRLTCKQCEINIQGKI